MKTLTIVAGAFALAMTAHAAPAFAAAPQTAITSITDSDSGTTLIDEDGSGDETVRTAFSGSGISSSNIGFRCNYDNAGPVTCTSPFSKRLKVGSHTVTVQAYNKTTGERDQTPARRSFVLNPRGGSAPAPPVAGGPPPAPPAPAGWTLVFADEFNGTDLGPQWERYGATSDWPGHSRNGLRVGRAVTVRDGMAHITAREVNNVIESGAFTIKDPALRRTYGRYEATILTEDDPSRTMSGVALLWNVNESAHPWCSGEADFYETGTSRDDFSSFLHYEIGTPNCSDATTQDHCGHELDPRQWHHVALEWEPNRWAVYVDGVQRCVVTNAAHIPDWAQRLTFQYDAFKSDMGSVVTRMKIARAAIYRR